jgi:hypothetical protein
MLLKATIDDAILYEYSAVIEYVTENCRFFGFFFPFEHTDAPILTLHVYITNILSALYYMHVLFL